MASRLPRRSLADRPYAFHGPLCYPLHGHRRQDAMADGTYHCSLAVDRFLPVVREFSARTLAAVVTRRHVSGPARVDRTADLIPAFPETRVGAPVIGAKLTNGAGTLTSP